MRVIVAPGQIAVSLPRLTTGLEAGEIVMVSRPIQPFASVTATEYFPAVVMAVVCVDALLLNK